MKRELRIKNIVIKSAVATIVFLFLFIIHNSLFVIHAQVAPELMVTWKAGNYAPPDYQGKVLPIGGTTVRVAVEVIDGGRLADLSRNEIRWLVNNELIQSGRGEQNISFIANQFKQDQIVNVSVPSYRGTTLSKRVIIPLSRPEVVIDGNLEGIRALAYFFNVPSLSQLQFDWTANGASAEVIGSNVLDLEIGTAISGSQINLSVQVQNLANFLENAVESTSFTLR